MDRHLHRYFLGALGFAFVLSWATVGLIDACLAAAACLSAANLHRLPRVRAERRPAPRRRSRPMRTSIAARPLQEESGHGYQLVPDEPSLIIGAQ